MPTETPKRSGTALRFLLTFAIVYLLMTMGLRFFFPERLAGEQPKTEPVIELTAAGKSFPLGRNVDVIFHNKTETGITLQDRCPEPPLIIERVEDEKFFQIDAGAPVVPCLVLPTVAPQSSLKISLSPWKYRAFAEAGTYRLSLPATDIPAGVPTEKTDTEIRITEPGVFTSLFRTFITEPLLNGLILIASIVPNHSLGWSIIFLTILVRIVLFFPSHHALKSQKKLQAVQPKIEEIKRKHAGDQQKITKETMELWKQEKINPFQSCLPTLVQIPILLGLFFIIRDSGTMDLTRHLLYAPIRDFSWSLSTVFLGFLDMHYVPFEEITSWFPTPSVLIILIKNGALPFLIAALQFVQMWMTFAKKKAVENKPLAERLDPQVMMQYMLPVMLFFIAGGLPAAVSLYWGTSTLFSIGQQAIVNRKKA